MKLASYQTIVELNLDGTKRKYVKTPAFGRPGFFEVFPYIEENREEAKDGTDTKEAPKKFKKVYRRPAKGLDLNDYTPNHSLKQGVGRGLLDLAVNPFFFTTAGNQLLHGIPPAIEDNAKRTGPATTESHDWESTPESGIDMWGVPPLEVTAERHKKKRGGSTDWPPRRVIPFMPPPIDASLQSVVGIRYIPNNEKKTYVLNDWRKGIHNMENATNKGLVVTPQNDSIWYPYDSYEGGAKTVYDGLKLNPGTDAEKIIQKQGYLTNFQAKGLLWDALSDHYDKAKKTYNATVGDGSWDELSIEEQKVLADYAYTGVLHEFKNFMRGIKNKDSETIRREYKRYINGKPLKSRNDETKTQLEHIIDSHGYRSPNK